MQDKIGVFAMKKIFSLLIVVAIIFATINFSQAAENFSEKYRLEKILILSRHNLRAPTAYSTAISSEVTNHKWFNWTSKLGELSTRGELVETSMGQYFREYLERENFITENYIPAENEFRFYANSSQRTIATAQFFSSGMLPVANVKIEYKNPVGERDEIFIAKFGNVSENYRQEIFNQILARHNAKNFHELAENLKPSLNTLEKILDFKNSPYAKKNNIQHFPIDDLAVNIEQNKSISWNGGIQKASSTADALIMQYYETDQTFGRKLTDEQLNDIKKIHDFAMGMIFGTPKSAVVLANPMLKFLRDENSAEGRKFTFICGHDSNIMSVLAALGVEKYNLPGPVEGLTPIGVKIVVEKRISEDNKEYAKIYLAYPSAEQIKNLEMISLENPPQIFNLSFNSLQKQENGLYLYSDFEKLLNSKIE